MKITLIYKKSGDYIYKINGKHSIACNDLYDSHNSDNNIVINKYEEFKNKCIMKFNSLTDYNRKDFIKICQKIYSEEKWNFQFSKSKISNMIN